MVKVVTIFTKWAAFLLPFGASLSGKSGRRKRFFFLSVKERISGDIHRFVGTSLVGALWTIRLQGPEAAVTGSEDIGHEMTLGGIWPSLLLGRLFSMSKRLD